MPHPEDPQTGFAQLSAEDIECALRTLGEMESDPLADLSERQKAICKRVGAIWREEIDG